MDLAAANIELLKRNGFELTGYPERWQKDITVGRTFVKLFAEVHGAGVQFFAYGDNGRLADNVTATIPEVRRVRSSMWSRGSCRLDDFS